MMHTHEELYKINGQKLYTWDYIEANNIPKSSRHDNTGWSKCYYLGPDKGTKKIYTAQGMRIVYTYGEKTWFDTEAERDEYRAQRNVERVEETKRNKMLKVIMEHYKTLSTEELEKLVATL